MLNIGTEDSYLIAGIRASAAMHSLKVEELSVGETAARFPAFAPPPDSLGILERAAGWLDVNASLKFGLERAAECGA
jgi:hypothetical protein